MSNLPLDQNFDFDTELSLSPVFTNTPQLVGVLSSKPVILLVKNQTNQTIFFANNSGSEKGTTMIAGEHFVLDCRGNKGNAVNGSFPQGTPFYATVPIAGTGSVRVSVIYAK